MCPHPDFPSCQRQVVGCDGIKNCSIMQGSMILEKLKFCLKSKGMVLATSQFAGASKTKKWTNFSVFMGLTLLLHKRPPLLAMLLTHQCNGLKCRQPFLLCNNTRSVPALSFCCFPTSMTCLQQAQLMHKLSAKFASLPVSCEIAWKTNLSFMCEVAEDRTDAKIDKSASK